jgi:hypothetical protein
MLYQLSYARISLFDTVARRSHSEARRIAFPPRATGTLQDRESRGHERCAAAIIAVFPGVSSSGGPGR